MYKNVGFSCLLLFLWIFQAINLHAKERMSVSPQSLSVRESQKETQIIEVKNLASTYISVKTHYDTSWISIYPDDFLLLPSQKQRVLVVFSRRDTGNHPGTGEIVFLSKGEKKKVMIHIVSTPSIVNNNDLQSVTEGKGKTISKDATVVSGAASPTALNRGKMRDGIPTRKENDVQEDVQKSENLVEPAEKLELRIKTLEQNLKKSKTEIDQLTQKIRQQDSRIAELLPQLSEDMLAELKDLYGFIKKYFTDEIDKNVLDMKWFGDKFLISIDGNKAFISGSTNLEKGGLKILTQITDILNNRSKYDLKMKVIGHADALPISQRLKNKFPSNWELSSIRAATIVRTLDENLGIDGRNLVLEAFAHYRPIADNRTKTGRMRNRRVEIIVSNQDEEALFVNSNSPVK